MRSPGRCAGSVRAHMCPRKNADAMTPQIPPDDRMVDQQPAVWRRLVPGDADRLAVLEEKLFADESPWPAAALRAEIAAPHTWYIGCEVGGLLVGYAGIGRLGSESEPEFEVHTLGVDPSFQRRGIGRGLMERLLAYADGAARPEAHKPAAGPVFLEVRADNEPAKRLYQSLGFEFLALRKGYYQPVGADAWSMRRPPRPAPGAAGDYPVLP